jgi:hypothetical protein
VLVEVFGRRCLDAGLLLGVLHHVEQHLCNPRRPAWAASFLVRRGLRWPRIPVSRYLVNIPKLYYNK